MKEALNDVRSVTGTNMRNIMLLLGKRKISEVSLNDLSALSYFNLDETQQWRVPLIKELMKAKTEVVEVPGFDLDELQDILHHLCTE